VPFKKEPGNKEPLRKRELPMADAARSASATAEHSERHREITSRAGYWQRGDSGASPAPLGVAAGLKRDALAFGEATIAGTSRRAGEPLSQVRVVREVLPKRGISCQTHAIRKRMNS
jgi:hypothetical protein